MAAKDKVMENRLRRKADRMGMRLVRSRRRDPDALGFGCYYLTDHETGGVNFGADALGNPGASLEEIREYLES